MIVRHVVTRAMKELPEKFVTSGVQYHTAAHAQNLRHDSINAKVSCVIPKQSDWSIMMS